MPHNLGLWSPSSMQSVAEVLSSPFSSTVVNERYGDHVGPAAYSAYGPSQSVVHWDSHTAFDPQGTVVDFIRPTASSTFWQYFFDQSSAQPSQACVCSSHATQSHYPTLSNDKNVTESSIPHPSLRSFSPTSPHFVPTQLQPGLLKQILVPISLSIVHYTGVHLAADELLVRSSMTGYGSTKRNSSKV